MLEKALRGSTGYWALLGLLGGLVTLGMGFYAQQYTVGLGITGLSRDVPWGFYIAQFTFLVGVGASAVMLVLPYYLHHFKAFGRIVILGEFLSIAAVLTCLLFVLVDMGQPLRFLNVILYPTPRSPMFWDVLSLSGYLLLNIVIAFGTLGAERKGVAPARWLRPLVWLSIPWAVSIHTVTAFIYAGLEARTAWRTAILAPRFLASAFASGPSLLILLCLLLRWSGKFDAGDEAIQRLRQIVAYALVLSAFFFGVELFTVLYANIPEELSHLRYLFSGLDGKTALRGWMWASQALVLLALVVLLLPGTRGRDALLALGCAAAVVGIWFEKGMGTVVGGFIPNCFDQVSEYRPTAPELAIAVGVYGLGALILTILYKIAVGVRQEIEN
jgi:Ni/Fe-hydrogenase subunit HybB-like protein